MGSGGRGTRRAGKSRLSTGYRKPRARLHVALGWLSRAVLRSDTPGQTPKSPWGLGSQTYKTVKQEMTTENRVLVERAPGTPISPPSCCMTLSYFSTPLTPSSLTYEIRTQTFLLQNLLQPKSIKNAPFVQQSWTASCPAVQQLSQLLWWRMYIPRHLRNRPLPKLFWDFGSC